MGLREMSQAVGGELHGPDAMFTGVSTDTRTLEAGQLFVALSGPNFDGHAFIEQARSRHAAGALVERTVPTELPCVTVEDTRLGLGAMAGYWRDRFDCPIVAVTGSNGKTTVKEMIGSILGERGPVLVSSGNLNNDIGLPLVLCRLQREHTCAVVEMGMNHPGEIDYLTRIARPYVAVITNAAPAHLEGLGSVEAIALAKAEIFNGLDPNGTAVINADDAYASLWRHSGRNFKRVSFGIDHAADITAEEIISGADSSTMNLCTPAGTRSITLPLCGAHNIMNALAAAAAALAAGADLEQVKSGLESVTPVAGRLETHAGAGGATVIDDSYNANPASMVAAIQVLAAASGEKILVLGDMKELGDAARMLHARVGEQALAAGVDRLLAVGPMSRAATEAFGAGAEHFDDKASLTRALLPSVDAGATVLVKGSRGMRMEDVVAAITGSGVRH